MNVAVAFDTAMVDRPSPSAGPLAAVAAATATACTVSLLGGFGYILALGDFSGGWLTAAFYIGLTAAALALPLSALLFVVLGLPLHAVSVRTGWTSALTYAAVGLALSCLVAVGAALVFTNPQDRVFAVSLLPIGGTAATLSFWGVARPDK